MFYIIAVGHLQELSLTRVVSFRTYYCIDFVPAAFVR